MSKATHSLIKFCSPLRLHKHEPREKGIFKLMRAPVGQFQSWQSPKVVSHFAEVDYFVATESEDTGGESITARVRARAKMHKIS